MERESSALDFGETIESLRNEVESMWNDIKISFDKIDQEIDQTISQYKPSLYDTAAPSIVYEEDQEQNEDSLQPSKHTIYPSVSTASASGSSLHRTHRNSHSRNLSPIQKAFNLTMEHSPAPQRQQSYSTPIQAHTMTNRYFPDRLRNYFSDDDEHKELDEDPLPTQKIDITVFSDIEKHNTNTMDIANGYGHSQKQKQEHTDDEDRESGHSMEYLFRENHTDSEDGDSVIISVQQLQRQSSTKRASLTAPQGLANIDIKAELAKTAKAKPQEEEEEDQYPGLLPTIPQTSSVDHTVTNKNASDIMSKHEKKKSLSQMMIQDLELDRKFNIESRKAKKTIPSPNLQSIENKASQPLTPLALFTQIGADMPDMDMLYKQATDTSDFALPITHSAINNISNASATTVPSPPALNGGSLARNSRKFTPKAIGSSDYINIFNEDQETTQFEYEAPRLEMGSRVSINANHLITDINYANNHQLASGINRADSDYKPMINKDIDAIMNELQPPIKKPLSPVAKPLHKVSYSFDDTNTLFDKTPVIDEETLDFKNNADKKGECSVEFNEIEETILIIKQDGIQFVNEICDRLVNDDDFYIKQIKQIQSTYTEYDDMYSFLDEHSANLNHSTDDSVKSAVLLFNELLLKKSFAIMPLYRSKAVVYLYECCTRYQSLQLLDDEVLHNTTNLTPSYLDHYHLKKPTDELQALDNVHFDDYDEYPSDEDRKDEEEQRTQSSNIKTINREIFQKHVYCPKTVDEYNVIKRVLWAHSDYNTYHDKYDYVNSIAIIKPNALKRYGMIIRATLIGNGFLVSKCKAMKYSANDDALQSIIRCVDSKTYYERDIKLQNKVIQYLSSAMIGVIVIKKAIGVDTCLNAKQCFHQLSQLIGYVDPQIDREKDANTQSIRGCFGDDVIHNAVDVTLTTKDFNSIHSIVF